MLGIVFPPLLSPALKIALRPGKSITKLTKKNPCFTDDLTGNPLARHKASAFNKWLLKQNKKGWGKGGS